MPVADFNTREEHLAWCKKRALEYVEIGDFNNAFNSMSSDLSKHDETRDHIGIQLGMLQMMQGDLNTPDKMRDWITGFN